MENTPVDDPLGQHSIVGADQHRDSQAKFLEEMVVAVDVDLVDRTSIALDRGQHLGTCLVAEVTPGTGQESIHEKTVQVPTQSDRYSPSMHEEGLAVPLIPWARSSKV